MRDFGGVRTMSTMKKDLSTIVKSPAHGHSGWRYLDKDYIAQREISRHLFEENLRELCSGCRHPFLKYWKTNNVWCDGYASLSCIHSSARDRSSDGCRIYINRRVRLFRSIVSVFHSKIVLTMVPSKMLAVYLAQWRRRESRESACAGSCQHRRASWRARELHQLI